MATSKVTYLGDLRTSSIHLQSGSEIISEPDCKCIEEVRKSPKYVSFEVAIIVLV